jgi:hypothetical protein
VLLVLLVLQAPEEFYIQVDLLVLIMEQYKIIHIQRLT